ncbi:MAG: hypothetical protein ACREL3_04185 [Gemmatimonadales bacterium]
MPNTWSYWKRAIRRAREDTDFLTWKKLVSSLGLTLFREAIAAEVEHRPITIVGRTFAYAIVAYMGLTILEYVWHLIGAPARLATDALRTLESVQGEVIGLRSRVVALEHDQYAYGLTAGIHANWDKTNTAAAFQISLQLNSVVDAPLKYHVDAFRVTIGGHSLSGFQFAGSGGVIAKRGNDLFRYAPFPQRVIDELGKRFTGRVECTIRYGHPDAPYARMLKRTIDVNIRLESGEPAVSTGVVSSSDESLQGQPPVAELPTVS